MRALPLLASRTAVLFVAAASAALVAGCTSEAEPARASRTADQCFRPDMVRSFRAVGNDQVYVTVGSRNVYALDTAGACPDVDWSLRIGIRPRGGGGSWVCQGGDAELVVPRPGGGVDSCPVTNVRRLGEAEVQAWRESRDR